MTSTNKDAVYMREWRRKLREEDPVKYRAYLDNKNATRNAQRASNPSYWEKDNAKRRDRYKNDPKYRSQFFTDERREYSKQLRQRRKHIVFSHYGMSCACCEESNLKFLSIDHVNGGGNKHIKEIGRGALYTWLIRNNFPEGFQTLCFNCNLGRAINDGVCPHQ